MSGRVPFVESGCRLPFAEGEIIRSRDTGKRYRVMRPYVEQERPNTYPRDLFELVCIDPHEPHLMALSMAEFFEIESGR